MPQATPLPFPLPLTRLKMINGASAEDGHADVCCKQEWWGGCPSYYDCVQIKTTCLVSLVIPSLGI